MNVNCVFNQIPDEPHVTRANKNAALAAHKQRERSEVFMAVVNHFMTGNTHINLHCHYPLGNHHASHF